MATNRPRRAEARCSARATRSLPVPVSPCDEHHGVGGAHPGDQRADIGQGGAVAHQVARARQRLPQLLVLFGQAGVPEGVADAGEQPFGRRWLLDEVGRPQPQRRHGVGGRGFTREHDHRHRQRPGKPFEVGQAGLAGHPQVEQHEVGRRGAIVKPPVPIGHVPGLDHLEPLVAQHPAHAAQDPRIVVDHQHARLPPAHEASSWSAAAGSSTGSSITARVPPSRTGSRRNRPPWSWMIL